ncbi:BspA family leucine-rich repeat surface protein [Dyadobacter jiangsuensis]
MKNLFTFIFAFLLSALHASGQYITVWKTDNIGESANNQIIIPATGTDYSVAWEEVGNPTNNGATTASGHYTLTFPAPGIYQVSISPGSGTFTQINFGGESDRFKLIELKQWGDIQWESMETAYLFCNKMIITATDIPNLQHVTSMSNMFSSTGVTSIPGINSWDVSGVTNMQGLFSYTRMNEPLENWDVGNVTNMNGMFSNSDFNQPIGNWDVSKVTDMSFMFSQARNFNQPIGSWDVGKVTDMPFMFSETGNFNQPIGSWDVSSVTTMQGMFSGASNFNQALDSWQVGEVTDMQYMFDDAAAFNGAIGGWDVGNVTNMGGMFNGAVAFNQPIGNWDVSKVTDMSSMFNGATAFNHSLANWDVSNVTAMPNMFYQATSFNQPVDSWNVGKVTDMYLMFAFANSFNQPVNNWDVSKVTNMVYMFAMAPNFNQPLNKWTLASAPFMISMLLGTKMDCVNMGLTLQGWAANVATPDSIIFGAENISYGSQAATALDTLTNSKGWTITIGDDVECEALEVSLIHFNAKNVGAAVKFDWATASETDNDYFEVERSADVRAWQAIGRLKGAGTVSIVQNYAFTDSNPLEGVSYYRLKIVDFNGKVDYSMIKPINIQPGSALSIYPNPATSSVTISGKAAGYFKIFHSSGRKVMQMRVHAEKTTIPISGLPAGAYVIVSDNGLISKFVKD